MSSKVSNTVYTFATPIDWTDYETVCRNEWAEKAQAEAEAHQQAEEAAELEEMKAEWEAEMRNEQYFENRGYDEARAQEDYDARMGNLDYMEAMELYSR